MTDRADHPLLDRRRFLVAGLGVMLAACAGTDTGDSTDTAAAAPTTDDEPSSPTSSPDDTTASPSPTDEPASPSEEPSAPEPSTPEYPTGVIPVAIVIPAIDVDAPVVDLSLTATEVEVPEDFGDAGWWTQTRRPGEIGPAVIGGHVDSKSGPAVFYRLADLRPGDEVTVADEAGETRSFVVSEDPIRVRISRSRGIIASGR